MALIETGTPTLQLLSAEEIAARKMPVHISPGIYFLIKRDEVVYVGQSIAPVCRLGEHVRRLDFDSFSVMPCKRGELDFLEAAYIRLLKPRYNKSPGLLG